MRKVVGIDLGTTFSAIAHINEFGSPEIIPNAEGERITPSVILFDDDVTIVGETAWRSAVAEPEKITQFVKLQMGKSKDEFSMEFEGKEYSAEKLSALILKKLKQDAEAYLGTEITDAVVTVPAYFKDAERQATRNAGKIADLNVLQVMNEPTAAALAYGVRHHDADQAGQIVFVFDLGGGTFDVTVMRVSDSELEMVATNGDHSLGGKDWDERIINYMAETFEIEHGENPLDDPHTRQDFQQRAVDAKQTLSAKQKTRIVCGHNGNSTRVELTQEKFAELTNDLLDRCGALCDVVLSEASMTWADIDTVLLAGGSTRMPMVREMITNISGKKINPLEVNPDDVVALGAAIQGTFRQIEEVMIEGKSDAMKKEDIPTAVKDRFLGSGGELAMKAIDGATHNLGLIPFKIVDGECKEQYIHVMIPKMTPIPCEETDTFVTLEDNQSSLLIEVVQGLEHNRLYADILQDVAPDEGEEKQIEAFEKMYKLGECLLTLPPGLPKGSPVDVTYRYNLDQTLEVTAKGPNETTANVTIQRRTLDDEEVREAARHLQRMEVE